MAALVVNGQPTADTRPPSRTKMEENDMIRNAWVESGAARNAMHRILAAALVFSMGCGTILNGGTATLVPPRGATVDGVAGPVAASKQTAHQVVYQDGHSCVVESHVSIGYAVADIVIWVGLLGVIVDAVTGDWKILDAGACPGVIVN